MAGNPPYSFLRYSSAGVTPVETSAAFTEELGVAARSACFGGRRGRYSLLRYSVNPPKKSVPVSAAFSESVKTVAGAAVPVPLREKYTSAMQGSLRGTVSVVSELSAASGLLAAVRMSADIITTAAMSAALQSAAYGQKNIPAGMGTSDTMTASVWASKNIPAVLILADTAAGRILGSKNIQAPLRVSEVFTSILEATSQTTERTTLQLTIPPGGELRIDSELFLVLLNGENALHTQSGDWINISRNLLRLIVESASGGQLQGQLIYTERYL